MPSLVTSIVLQWSADPLSDSTPTWTTVANTEIRSLEWWVGIDREGSDPEPGGMVVTLKNVNRKWEPLFGSNTIDTQQRFRLTLDGVQEGVWYTENFELDYPTGGEFSWVTITCGDGITVLALDDLPGLDPPDADSYAEVVEFDQPLAYWRFGDPEGTQAVAQARRVWRGKGKKRRRVKIRTWSTQTISEASGASGPSGSYRNSPALEQPGLIVGDSDKAVLFRSAESEFVRGEIEQTAFVTKNAFSIECWVKPTTDTGQSLMAGPLRTADAATIFQMLRASGTQHISIVVRSLASTGSVMDACPVGEITHVVGTFDGTTIAVYINGVLSASATSGGVDLLAGNANEFIYVGQDSEGAAYADAVIDEPAFYEYALSAERVLAHYQAGAERGFPQQTAGERIAEIVTSDLWAENEIQTTGRQVIPQMMHGQPRMDEIAELMQAEGPRTMFFFDGNGDPKYLGHEWQQVHEGFRAVQYTFADDGTGIPYQDVRLEYDFETFNEVLASREGGENVIVTDTTESAKRGRRVRTEETDLLLVEQVEVESLATHVLRLYAQPAKRPVTLTIDSHHAYEQILTLEIGDMIRVKKAGETGDPTDRIVNVIGKRKQLQQVTGGGLLHCTYTLSRGFDPAPATGGWYAGIVGFSEAGVTTEAA